MKKATILYVDDEPINLEIFAINLSEDYNVITAISGIDGLKKLEQNPEISAVISDMKMPRMTGLEFIKLAKSQYKQVNYFILTGFDITADIMDALNTKLILQYFKKPFDISEIRKALSPYPS